MARHIVELEQISALCERVNRIGTEPSSSTGSKDLNLSYGLFTDYFSNAPIGYLLVNENFSIINANRIASQLLGKAQNQLYDMKLEAFVDAPFADHLRQFLCRSSGSYEACTGEFRMAIPTADLGYMWLRIDAARSRNLDASGSMRILCSLVDVTSHRVLDDVLRVLALTNESESGMEVFDRFVNQMASETSLGCFFVARPVPDSDRTFRTLAVSNRSLEVPAVEYHLSSWATSQTNDPLHQVIDASDGDIFSRIDSTYKYVSHRIIRDFQGNMLCHFGFLSDRSFESEDLLCDIFDVCTMRLQAELTRLGERERNFSYQRDLEILVQKRTEEIAHRNEVLAREIAEREQTQRELEEAKVFAEKASSAKAIFLANMSHEIRTPLNGIIGLADLISRSKLPEIERQRMDLLKKSGDYLLSLINDILDLSRLESGTTRAELKEIDFSALVGEVIDSFLPKSSGKGLLLSCLYPPTVPTDFISDPILLRQVLINLVGNAVKFTDEGHVCIEVSCQPESGQLVFVVRDTGEGISSDKLSLIFEPYAQVSSAERKRVDGSGLGLAICRAAVNQLAGELDVFSQLGKGTEFRVSFPLIKPKASKSQKLRLFDHFQMVHLVVYENQFFKDLAHEYLDAAGTEHVIFSIRDRTKLTSFFRSNAYRMVKVFSEVGLREKILDVVAKAEPGNVRFYWGSFLPTIQGAVRDSGYSEYNLKLTSPENWHHTLELLCDDQSDQYDVHSRDDHTLDDVESGAFLQAPCILIAEDDEINQMVITAYCEKMNVQLKLVTDGEEVLDALRERNDYDLVILDCQMPRLDGFATVSKIREQSLVDPEIKVIALTAGVMAEDQQKCFDAGFDEFVAKPIKLAHLFNVINRITDGRFMVPVTSQSTPSLSLEH